MHDFRPEGPRLRGDLHFAVEDRRRIMRRFFPCETCATVRIYHFVEEALAGQNPIESLAFSPVSTGPLCRRLPKLSK